MTAAAPPLFNLAGAVAAAPAARLAQIETDYAQTAATDYARWYAYIDGPRGDPVLRGFVAFEFIHHPTLADWRHIEDYGEPPVDATVRHERATAVFHDLLTAALTRREPDAIAALYRLMSKYSTYTREWIDYLLRYEARAHVDARSMAPVSICEALEYLKHRNPAEVDHLRAAQIMFVALAFAVNNRPLLVFLESNDILTPDLWEVVIDNMAPATTHAEVEARRAALGWLRTATARRGGPGATELIAVIDEEFVRIAEFL